MTDPDHICNCDDCHAEAFADRCRYALALRTLVEVIDDEDRRAVALTAACHTLGMSTTEVGAPRG